MSYDTTKLNSWNPSNLSQIVDYGAKANLLLLGFVYKIF